MHVAHGGKLCADFLLDVPGLVEYPAQYDPHESVSTSTEDALLIPTLFCGLDR